jgi:T5SS/PEP-CTERM-associated repeat protein
MRHFSMCHAQSPVEFRNCATRLLSTLGVFHIAVVAGAIFVISICVNSASANVQTSGNVLPIDNPFDVDPLGNSVDTGLPALGNFLTVSSPPLPAEKTAAGQPEFEGVHSILDEPEAVPPVRVITQTNVLVGPSSFGQLLITGNTQLRDETLVIGGVTSSDTAAGFTLPPTNKQHGTGFVRITDPGSLYNNDPSILPFGLDIATFGSRRPTNQGFDLYVGRAGAGTLQIDTGGAAEIQDSIVVGDQSGSTGTIIVDGADSFLGNSGNFPANADPSDPGAMVIGRRGTGQMSLTNGAQVVANGPMPAAGTATVAAAIGSDPSTTNNPQVQAGGQGVVSADGVGTKWAIQGGSLQIGGFDGRGIDTNPASPFADVAGNNATGKTTNYLTNSGRATLNVSNGAVVTIDGGDPTSPPSSLDMLIGQYGTINLAGGSIEVNDQLDASLSNPNRTIFFVRTINDGVISGTGSITTGQFDNRSLGQVRVTAGQKLLITSTGEFQTGSQSTREPLSNYGLIEVIGTETARAEIEFDRSTPQPPDIPPTTDNPRPFTNFQQAAPPANGGRQFGQILGQNAAIRFQSGLENHSFLAFTGGVNVATGPITNCAANDPACIVSPANGQGQISVSGNGTSVTFEDTVTNNGLLTVGGINTTVTFKDPPINNGTWIIDSPNANVTVVGDLTLGANSLLKIALGSNLAVTGNLVLNGATISPILSGANNLMVGDLFTLLTYGGSLLPATATFQTISADLGNGLILIPVDPLSTAPLHIIEVKVCSTAGVCSIGGMAPGINDADLDGNGIVNLNDLAIWRSRFGLTGLGDVNGDGIVDAADYVIIRAHLGLPMGAGAGAGAGLGAAVPEPGSFALLLIGSMLALAGYQHRRNR